MSSGAPLVSVLVPAHNHRAFVEATLDSILQDGYPNLEIVVIDDGSTDGTWECVRRWCDRYGAEVPTRIVRQDNQGVVATLNRLLASARGTYAALLASDDRLIPGGIAARVGWLDHNPELWAVFGDSTVIDAAGRTTHGSAIEDLNRKSISRYERDLRSAIINDWGVAGPGLMVRVTDVIAAGGFREGSAVEDWDLYLRLSAAGRLGFLPVSVAEYRIHEANVSAPHNVQARHARDMATAASRARHLYSGYYRLALIQRMASYAALSARLDHRSVAAIAWQCVAVSLRAIEVMVRPIHAFRHRA